MGNSSSTIRRNFLRHDQVFRIAEYRLRYHPRRRLGRIKLQGEWIPRYMARINHEGVKFRASLLRSWLRESILSGLVPVLLLLCIRRSSSIIHRSSRYFVVLVSFLMSFSLFSPLTVNITLSRWSRYPLIGVQ